jgi:hypothetical protein
MKKAEKALLNKYAEFLEAQKAAEKFLKEHREEAIELLKANNNNVNTPTGTLVCIDRNGKRTLSPDILDELSIDEIKAICSPSITAAEKVLPQEVVKEYEKEGQPTSIINLIA